MLAPLFTPEAKRRQRPRGKPSHGPAGCYAAANIPAVRRHIARRPPALDLRMPPIAAWRGEVLLVASPGGDELTALAERALAARACAPANLQVGVVSAQGSAGRAAAQLAAGASAGIAVLALLPLAPDAAGRRQLAALGRAVALKAPCRSLWCVDGRLYPT